MRFNVDTSLLYGHAFHSVVTSVAHVLLGIPADAS